MKLISSPSDHFDRLLHHAGITFLVLLLLCTGVQTLHAQSTTTQQVAIDEGWNLLSLHVEPASNSLQDIFAEHLDAVLTVQNDDGQAFIPSLSIDQIGNWEVNEGYLLFATSAFVLEVEGTLLSTEPPPVEIAGGWSFIPFFPAGTMAVEEALEPLVDELVTAKTVSGVMYYPAEGVATLDSLRPGQGYQVFLSDARELQYPVSDAPASDTTEVPTLADALALEGLPAGHIVEVLGYHEPGDGGGGLFEITDGAERTDGATVFILDEDLSQEQVYTTGRLRSTENLPHTDLAWRTITARYGTAQHETIDVEFFNGHIQYATRSGSGLTRKTGRLEQTIQLSGIWVIVTTTCIISMLPPIAGLCAKASKMLSM